MTLYEEHIKLANDILEIIKIAETGKEVKEPFYLESKVKGYATYIFSTIKYRQKNVIRLSNNDIFKKETTISNNATSKQIRYIKDSSRFSFFKKGVTMVLDKNAPEFTLSEEQHFQNSLIYDDSTILYFVILGTLMKHTFKYNFFKLDLNYIDLLKEQFNIGIGTEDDIT